jgi:hypothetical protein
VAGDLAGLNAAAADNQPARWEQYSVSTVSESQYLKVTCFLRR